MPTQPTLATVLQELQDLNRKLDQALAFIEAKKPAKTPKPKAVRR